MREQDRCGLPYVRYGDIRECRLHFNHGGDCPDANAFQDGLEVRTQAAHDFDGPWL
jgi:hypothetical protein